MKRFLCAALLALALPSLAGAQAVTFPATLPANTVVGRLGNSAGPSQAIPFASLASFFTFSSGLNISPTASSLTQGLNITQSAPTTGTAAGPIYMNAINVTADGYAVTGVNNEIWGLAVVQVFGGNATGQRGAIYGVVSQTSTTNNSTASIGVTGLGVSSANAGGTGISAKGGVGGMNPIAQLQSGATNFAYLVGMESDVGIASGASSTMRIAVGAASNLPGLGSTYDAGYGIWASPSNGFKFAFQLMNVGTGPPLQTTGTILGTDGTAWTIANGVDLSSGLTITGFAFKSPAFSVDGNGNIIGLTYTASGFAVSPILYGGAAVGSSLSLISTAAVGTTDAIIFKVGNNGATEAGRFLHSGGLGIGTTSDPGVGMLYTNSASFMIRTKTSYTNGAAAQTATMTNGPTAGNPTKWIPVDDNGTTRFVPSW